MKYLFLMNEAECQNESTLEKLMTLSKSNDVVVLSLSTLASLALRRMGFDYVTPDLFFPKEKSSAIDKQSATYCREWYRVIDHPLMYFHGASIGEAFEFDFFHLFIDALRSVEIARSLLKESFETIYIPSLDSADSWVVVSCYYTLPSILAFIARKKGMNVIDLNKPSNVVAKTMIRLARPKQLFNSLIDSVFLSMHCAAFLFRNFGALANLLLDRERARSALAYHYHGLIRELRDSNGSGLKVYPSLVHTPKSMQQINGILSLLKDEKNVSRLDDSIVYDGTPLWRVLFPQVYQMLSKQVPLIIARMQWTELFVKLMRPASFVVLDDILALQRAMCQILKLHGIPVVIVQHGLLVDDFEGLFLLPKVGDVQAVWGEYYRKWHTDRGKPPESQVVTGFPRYDELLTLPPLDRDGLCRRFGMNPERRIVLVITEYFGGVSSRYTVEDEERYVRSAFRALKAYDDIQIVVKLHPQFQTRYHRIVSEFAQQEDVRVIIARDSLWDLIRASSFVIVSVSTVCLEALALGKRVVSINMSESTDKSGLVQNGLAIGAYNEEEINESVGICMKGADQDKDQDDERRRLLFPFLYIADGHASQRVAELIRAISIRSR